MVGLSCTRSVSNRHGWGARAACTAGGARRGLLHLGLLLPLALCAPASAKAQAAGTDPLSGSPVPSAISEAPVDGSAGDPVFIPDLSRILPKANSREALSSTLQIVVLLTLLTLSPSVLLMATCFTRILVVLALLRQALGTQQLPPPQVLVGLALFLTLLVMTPTWERIHERAIEPYLAGGDQLEAIRIAGNELRNFMFAQIKAAGNEEDVYLMHEYATNQSLPPETVLDEQDVPTTALLPAFLLSELRVAFILGFRIYLPFLVIDMVVATILVAMGMMMLPPVMISLPFKLLLFVLADGWHLVAGSLLASVQ